MKKMKSMKWTRIIINMPSSELDQAAAIAEMITPAGFQIDDYSDLIEFTDMVDEEDWASG